MAKEDDRRRKILISLIFKMEPFYLGELERSYQRKTGGKRHIDGFVTVKQFVQNLEEIGVLKQRRDKYIFAN
jgi:hypothetical protein